MGIKNIFPKLFSKTIHFTIQPIYSGSVSEHITQFEILYKLGLALGLTYVHSSLKEVRTGDNIYDFLGFNEGWERDRSDEQFQNHHIVSVTINDKFLKRKGIYDLEALKNSIEDRLILKKSLLKDNLVQFNFRKNPSSFERRYSMILNEATLHAPRIMMSKKKVFPSIQIEKLSPNTIYAFASKNNHDDLKTYRLLASFFYTEKYYPQAKTCLQKMIEVGNGGIWPWLKLSEVKTAMSDAKGRLETYEKIIQLYPKDIRGYTQLANFYWYRKEMEKVIETYQLAIENNPSNHILQGKIYDALAQKYRKKGQDEKVFITEHKAINQFTIEINKSKPNVWTYFDLINVYEKREDYTTALTVVNQLLKKLSPDWLAKITKIDLLTKAKITKANLLAKTGKIQEALFFYNKKFNHKSLASIAVYKKYIALQHQVNDPLAIFHFYDKLMKKEKPSLEIVTFFHKEIWKIYQRFLYDRDKQIDFITAKSFSNPFHSILQSKENDYSLHVHLGDAAAKYGLWPQAAAAYRFAIKLNSKAVEVKEKLNALPQNTHHKFDKLTHPSFKKTSKELPNTQNLVICVITCKKNKVNQDTIRNTWIRAAKKYKIPYYFIIGNSTQKSHVEDDILYVEAPDTYEHLPRKTFQMVKYIYENTAHAHIFKVDDDCYVSIENLLTCHFEKHDYIGKVLGDKLGIGGDWHLGKTTDKTIGKYKGQYIGDFASGGMGYFLSRNAMNIIVNYPDKKHLAEELYEDKMVGDILRTADIHPVHAADYRIGAEFINSNTQFKLRFGANAESPYPHQSNNLVLFHSDAAPEILNHIHENYENKAFQNRIFLRNPNWWQADDICLERKDNQEINLNADAVLGFLVVKNDLNKLTRLLSHYRNKGVSQFFIIDNHSIDETSHYLINQSDIFSWHTIRPAARANNGMDWIELLIAHYGYGYECQILSVNDFE